MLERRDRGRRDRRGGAVRPAALGSHAAAPAAFLALLAPRLAGRGAAAVALTAVAAALVAVPLTPAGVPVLVAALVAVAAR